MTYGNIIKSQKAGIHPLSRKCIFFEKPYGGQIASFLALRILDFLVRILLYTSYIPIDFMLLCILTVRLERVSKTKIKIQNNPPSLLSTHHH